MLIMARDASKRRPRFAPAVLTALGILAGLAAPPGARADAGAAQPPAAPVTFEDEVSVAWILVPVVVRSRRGFVDRLNREDFRLAVDGRQVAFQDFERRGEAPWSVVLLQDLSGSMGAGGRLEASQEVARFFFDQARPGDEFAIATFASGTTSVDVPFTEDLQALREAVGTWEAYGTTALHDAVAWLPEISGDSRNVKRAAILITDGVDNASAISAREARELVQQAELPVYVLGIESGSPFTIDRRGEKIYRYADVLNLLATLTGGRYFPVAGPNDVKEACAAIAEELRLQYVLGFDTSGRGESRFRRISVEVTKNKGYQIRTRQGYRGTAPAR